MSSFWICSECGSANVYPDEYLCEVCGKQISSEEMDKAKEIIKNETYDEKVKNLFKSYEDKNTMVEDKTNIATKFATGSVTYEVLEEKSWFIGSKAYDYVNNRYVTLKYLNETYQNASFQKRIKLRFVKLAPLRHPSLAQTFDICQQPSGTIVVEEYINCATLEEYMQAVGIVRYDDAIEITIEILNALVQMHSIGVVHRNLNQKNIKITFDNKIRISGLFIPFTKIQLDDFENYCVSPEQKEYENDKPTADVYAVGTLLYRMLNGRYPNRNGTETLAFCEKSRTTINRELPIGTEQIVLHAIKLQEFERYQTLYEMLTDLKKIQTNRFETFVFVPNMQTETNIKKKDTFIKSLWKRFIRK